MAALAVTLAAAGATAQDLGEVAFRQALKELGNDLRLMCVAAHPDDEDGATLAYYRMKYGVETHAVIATRGEGGQNEIGPELGNELGVIRTREMMAAAKITGAELHFLNLSEFGYSKTIEETYAVWDKREALERMVRVIREVRPNVIITHHGRTNDHGHHQAIGATLLEAFDAAAQPGVTYSQDGAPLGPWQVSRVYIRAWEPEPDSIEINIGELDALRGMTYAEIAAKALEEHKSQGMGFFIERFLTDRPKVYYDLVKEFPGAADAPGIGAAMGPFFSGIHVPGYPFFTKTARFDPAELVRLSRETAPREELKGRLLRAVDSTTWLLHNAERSSETWHAALRLMDKTTRAAALAMQFRVTAALDDDVVTPGQTMHITVKFQDFGARDTEWFEFGAPLPAYPQGRLASFDPAPAGRRKLDERGEAEARVTAVFRQDLDWSTLPLAEHLFDRHFLEPRWYVHALTMCGQTPIRISVPIFFDLAPKVSATFSGDPYLSFPGTDRSPPIALNLTNNTPGPHTAEPTVYWGYKDYGRVDFTSMIRQRLPPIAFSEEGEQKRVQLVPKSLVHEEPGDYSVWAVIEGQSGAAQGMIRVVDLSVPKNIRVGVVQSYDDTFVYTLERMGVAHETLSLRDFNADRLDTFSSIIIDIRAYLVRDDLRANNGALLDYVNRGGTLLVMYQKTFEWKPEFAPYPIQLSRNRVTLEDAPISLLVPDHPLFTTPNKIQPKDWDGWIQERGLYFPDQWDGAYTPLIACNDPGEEIPPGSCLIARHGNGAYLYTALGWYRQLRALHPGALRVFANMLAL